MNDSTTRERVGREAPLQEQVNWDVMLGVLNVRVVQDAKEGIKITSVVGEEKYYPVTVDVTTAIAEAEKRGWRMRQDRDRIEFFNDHHVAQKSPHGIFKSRNDLIGYEVKELKNLCGILGVSKRGKKITLMTRLADAMDLTMDEVALPAEQPAIIEPEPEPAAAAPVPEPAKAAAPIEIPTIRPPERDMNIIATMLICPYGRARPLIRQDLYADGVYSGWSEPIRGKTLDNQLNILLKMGTFQVTHGPSPYRASDGTRWKCVVLAHTPRAI